MTHEKRRQRRKEMAEYYKEHGSRATAEKFGVSDQTVYDAVREHSLIHQICKIIKHGHCPEVSADFANRVKREARRIGLLEDDND